MKSRWGPESSGLLDVPHICRLGDERYPLGIIPRPAENVFAGFAAFATSLRENRVARTENVAHAQP